MHSSRSSEKEWIDLGSDHYTPSEYKECLLQLDRIGRLLGGDRATFWGFDQLKQSPQSILDVGCGGGLFAIKLAKRYPKASVLGIDISAEAIQFALQQHAPSNVSFKVPKQPRLLMPADSFDVVTTTLVCHHLSDTEIISFLQDAFLVAKQALIINDLHRNFLAYLAYHLAIPLLRLNRLVAHDGLISIDRGFTRQEWIHYLTAAGIPLENCQISWHWAFRWVVVIHKANPHA